MAAARHSASQGHEVDEGKAMNAHQQAYEGGDTSNMGSEEMGMAAAMKVMKNFTGGGGGGGGGGAGGSGDMVSDNLSVVRAFE